MSTNLNFPRIHTSEPLNDTDFDDLIRQPWVLPAANQKREPAERSRIADVIFATVLGALLGAALAHWLAR